MYIHLNYSVFPTAYGVCGYILVCMLVLVLEVEDGTQTSKMEDYDSLNNCHEDSL